MRYGRMHCILCMYQHTASLVLEAMILERIGLSRYDVNWPIDPRRDFLKLRNSTNIYIYIYMCLCVCVVFCVFVLCSACLCVLWVYVCVSRCVCLCANVFVYVGSVIMCDYIGLYKWCI